MSSIRVGLALGSGGARGWAHIGVIDALAEAGVVPDVVCGTSMGALVGAVYAAGRLDTLRDWASRLDRRVVASLVDINVLSGGLVDGTRIVEWLSTLGLPDTIEALPVPFGAVATDLTNGREVWLQSGPLARSIRASISIPGVFSPVDLDHRWLVDGGLVNPVPVSLCRAMGADFTIAVNLNEGILGRRLTRHEEEPAETAEPPKNGGFLEMVTSMPEAARLMARNVHFFGSGATPGYFDVLSNALNIMQDQIARSRMAGEPPHATVTPLVIDIDILDFHRSTEAIKAGRTATQAAIPAIKAKLSALAV
jgi:NTE family protein